MEEERRKRFKTFEELEVWQDARILVNAIYTMTKEAEFSKDYALRDQIRHAAISVMSNIAEGFDRRSSKEFIQFLSVAKASSAEVRSQLYIAQDQNYINPEAFEASKKQLDSIAKQLAGFIRYLQRKDSNS